MLIVIILNINRLEKGAYSVNQITHSRKAKHAFGFYEMKHLTLFLKCEITNFHIDSKRP